MLALALLVAGAGSKLVPSEGTATNANIEGLRGVLAMGVFAHHVQVWRNYSADGTWQMPTEDVFAQLGQASVMMFFMITAFLFTSQVLARRDFDWTRFAVSRVLRLYPLYLAVTGIVFVLVVALGPSTAATPVTAWLRWMGLGILGTPDLGGIPQTARMVAWVYWSLPYEVLFYLMVPLLALAARRRVDSLAVAVSLVGAAFMLRRGLLQITLLAFLPGIIAAAVRPDGVIARFAKTSWAALVVSACALIVTTICASSFEPLSFAAITLAFILIARGCSVFGLLDTAACRTLGRVSYSLYLLHGIALYLLFQVVLSLPTLHSLERTSLDALIAVLTIALIGASMVSYLAIERRFMRLSGPLSDRARQFLNAVSMRFNGTRRKSHVEVVLPSVMNEEASEKSPR